MSEYHPDICRPLAMPRQSGHLSPSYGALTAEKSKNFEGRKALVVERFDRRWSSDGSWLMRVPQEDFCQALGIASARKYESDGGPSIRDGMDLLLGSQQPIEHRTNFFRSQIIFGALAAFDGHAKNFSLLLEPGDAYLLPPI